MIQLISDFLRITGEEYFEYTDEAMNKDEPLWIGHRGDNHRNESFNQKLIKLLNNPNAYVLDIGCGHGECIEDLANLDYNAIGVDGWILFSKYSPTWIRHPELFFRCDLGKPFILVEDGQQLEFDCVMSWECFEHIRECDIDQLIINIDNHTKKDSLFICSIGKTNENVHRTLKDKSWWLERFSSIGLEEKELGFDNDLIRHTTSDLFFMVKIKE